MHKKVLHQLASFYFIIWLNHYLTESCAKTSCKETMCVIKYTSLKLTAIHIKKNQNKQTEVQKYSLESAMVYTNKTGQCYVTCFTKIIMRYCIRFVGKKIASIRYTDWQEVSAILIHKGDLIFYLNILHDYNYGRQVKPKTKMS